MAIRVLVVDDDPFVRNQLSMILSTADDIDTIGEAGDGDEAVPMTIADRPDVVLMDIKMPRVDGIAAAGKVTALARPPKVLMLTTFGLDEYVLNALEAGADGFILKDEPPVEIINAVRIVASGDSILSPSITAKLINTVVSSQADPSRQRAKAQLPALSDREREIVAGVAHGKSNADIAADLFLSEATVKTHLTRIFTKLDVSNRVQIAIFAFKSGLVDI